MFHTVLVGEEEEGDLPTSIEYGKISLREFDGQLEKDVLFDDVVGVKWDLGNLITTLPQVDSDESRIAEPYTHQLVSRPRAQRFSMAKGPRQQTNKQNK